DAYSVFSGEDKSEASEATNGQGQKHRMECQGPRDLPERNDANNKFRCTKETGQRKRAWRCSTPPNECNQTNRIGDNRSEYECCQGRSSRPDIHRDLLPIRRTLNQDVLRLSDRGSRRGSTFWDENAVDFEDQVSWPES